MPKPKPSPGDRLRDALLRHGLSQTRAAEILEISQPSLHQYLSGRRPIKLDWLYDVAAKLGIDPAELDERFAPTMPRKRGPARWLQRQDLTGTDDREPSA